MLRPACCQDVHLLLLRILVSERLRLTRGRGAARVQHRLHSTEQPVPVRRRSINRTSSRFARGSPLRETKKIHRTAQKSHSLGTTHTRVVLVAYRRDDAAEEDAKRECHELRGATYNAQSQRTVSTIAPTQTSANENACATLCSVIFRVPTNTRRR